MKTQTLFRMLSLSLLFVMLGSVAMAQTKEEKKAMEEEMKIKQEQIEMQRKQMKEQQLKTIELEKAYAEQARASSRAREAARVYTRSSGFGDEGSYFIYSGGQENQSQLTIRNSFDGETDTSKGEFDVDQSTSHIRCTINGKARSGKINIKVLYPGGKVFKDLSITSSAEISFSQSMSLEEDEKNKYVGAWTYQVIADKAEGSYTLSFMTH
jgi:hypothetical protein